MSRLKFVVRNCTFTLYFIRYLLSNVKNNTYLVLKCKANDVVYSIIGITISLISTQCMYNEQYKTNRTKMLKQVSFGNNAYIKTKINSNIKPFAVSISIQLV